MPMRQILVTSALPYANGQIHIGHLVEYIQTDIWVRFQRMRGHEVHYVGADDTHGTPIMLRAEKEGITPEQLIANVQAEHTADFADFGVDFDNYHSTHSEENRELSASIYLALRDKGHATCGKSTVCRPGGVPRGCESLLQRCPYVGVAKVFALASYESRRSHGQDVQLGLHPAHAHARECSGNCVSPLC